MNEKGSLTRLYSDTGGSTAVKLIDMLCDGKKLTLEDVEAVRHKRCHHTSEEMLEACTGYMSEHKIYMLQQIRECNKKLQERIDELDKRIKAIM